MVSELALVWCGVPQSVACKCQQDLGNPLLPAAAWGATACSCLLGSHLIFFCLSPCPSHKCCSIILYLLRTQFQSLSALISPTQVELHVVHLRLVLSLVLLGVCCSRHHRVNLFVLVSLLTVISSAKIL